MAERQYARVPQGRTPDIGIAQMMPGATAQVQPQTVRVRPVQLYGRAPKTLKRAGGVMVDGAALAAGAMGEARAAETTGNAVQGAVAEIGQQLFQYAATVEKAKEDTDLMMAQMEWNKAWDIFHANLPNDPNQWPDSFKEKADEIRDRFLDPNVKLRPGFRRKLDMNFRVWETEAESSLSSMRITRHKQIAETQFSAAAKYALETENLPEYKNLQAQAAKSGIITNEAANFNVKMAERDVQAARFGRDIENSPHEVEAHVAENGFPSFLTPDEQDKAKRTLRTAKRIVESQEAERVANTFAAKPDMSEIEARHIVKSTHLGSEDQEQLFQHWFKKSTPNPEKVEALSKDIKALTPDTPDETKAEVWKRIQTTTARGTWLHEHLSESFGAYIADRTGGAYKSNLKTGISQIEAMVEKEKSRVGSAMRDPAKANEAKLRTESDYRAWLSSQEKQPTEDQIFNWLDKHGLTPPKKSREEQLKAEVQTGLPVPAEMPWWKRQLTGW